MKFQHDWTLDGEIKSIQQEMRHGSSHRVNFRYMLFLLITAFVMLASSCYAGWECRSCGYYNLSDKADYCGVCGSWNTNPKQRLDYHF